MRDELKDIFIRGCNKKIEKKGENVGLSFYAFFKNKNDNPELGGNLIIIDLLHVLPWSLIIRSFLKNLVIYIFAIKFKDINFV